MKRLYGLDIFRIICALIVFLFHALGFMGSNFGTLQPFISVGAVTMTGLFMLSGFSLFYTYGFRDFSQRDTIVEFYKKRIIAILPVYYLMSVVAFLLKGFDFQDILLIPIEALGLQSFFPSIAHVGHNGGTWFISCVLIGYLLFPFMAFIVRHMRKRTKCLVFAALYLLEVYTAVLAHYNVVDAIYSNPLFRSGEMLLGCILCSEMQTIMKLPGAVKKSSALIGYALLYLGCTFCVNYGLYTSGDYMGLTWFTIPVFTMIILGSLEWSFTSGTVKKIIRYMSRLSYPFYLAQLFSFWITKRIVTVLPVLKGNYPRVLVAFIVCFAVSVLAIELFENPINKLLKRF